MLQTGNYICNIRTLKLMMLYPKYQRKDLENVFRPTSFCPCLIKTCSHFPTWSSTRDSNNNHLQQCVLLTSS